MLSTNPVISLEANSLYVATNQLMSQSGKYHWSVYLTNASGVATKYHWATLEPTSDPSGKYEGVQWQVKEPTTTYSEDLIITFAYLKVKGFTPPESETFRKIALEAFPAGIRLGFTSLKENRNAGLTCRTWTLHLLASLKAQGWLHRRETPEWFEERVKATTVYLEQKCADGELDESFVGEI